MVLISTLEHHRVKRNELTQFSRVGEKKKKNNVFIAARFRKTLRPTNCLTKAFSVFPPLPPKKTVAPSCFSNVRSITIPSIHWHLDRGWKQTWNDETISGRWKFPFQRFTFFNVVVKERYFQHYPFYRTILTFKREAKQQSHCSLVLSCLIFHALIRFCIFSAPVRLFARFSINFLY